MRHRMNQAGNQSEQRPGQQCKCQREAAKLAAGLGHGGGVVGQGMGQSRVGQQGHGIGPKRDGGEMPRAAGPSERASTTPLAIPAPAMTKFMVIIFRQSRRNSRTEAAYRWTFPIMPGSSIR